ncbi:MAG: hypothetical protein ACRDT2_05775 [Natronosporangium sp.]
MTAPTAKLVGDLLTEEYANEPAYDLEAPPQTTYRPVGVPLINDGMWHHWMMSGESYRLEHDGTGWRVTGGSWPGGRIYRLADIDGELVATLPLVNGGILTLEPRRAYRLQEVQWCHWVVLDAGR